MPDEKIVQDPNLEKAPTAEEELESALEQAQSEAVNEQETEEIAEEATQSALEDLMGKKGFKSADDVATSYANLEREKSRLARELKRLKMQTMSFSNEQENQRQYPEQVESDKTVGQEEFLNNFAKDPIGVLKKLVNSEVENRVKPIYQKTNDLERERAIDYITSQSDYNDEMLDNIQDVLLDHANDYYTIGNRNYQLKDLSPMDKARAALQILRENTVKTEVKKSEVRKPPTVTTTKKVINKQPVKNDNQLSSAELLKKYPALQKEGVL